MGNKIRNDQNLINSEARKRGTRRPKKICVNYGTDHKNNIFPFAYQDKKKRRIIGSEALISCQPMKVEIHCSISD